MAGVGRELKQEDSDMEIISTSPLPIGLLIASIQMDAHGNVTRKERLSGKASQLQRVACAVKKEALFPPNYARNFICDFILGKAQKYSQLTFDFGT